MRSIEEVTSRQYKNAQTILCEFMALQKYDMDEGEPPKYEDFNLQQLHEYIAEKIEVLDSYYNRYQGQRGKFNRQRNK